MPAGPGRGGRGPTDRAVRRCGNATPRPTGTLLRLRTAYVLCRIPAQLQPCQDRAVASSDHYGTVVSGNLVLVVDGKENKLPAGSYFAFTGKAKHATRCEAGADCVLAIDSRGKWDVVPADAKPAAKK